MRSDNFEDDINQFEHDQEANAIPDDANEDGDDINILPGRQPADDENEVDPAPDGAVPTTNRATVERYVAPNQYSEEEYSRLMR